MKHQFLSGIIEKLDYKINDEKQNIKEARGKYRNIAAGALEAYESVQSWIVQEYPELQPLRDSGYRPKTDPVSLVVYGFKAKTGILMDDRAWDKANWGWAAKEAKKMIDYLATAEIALDCLSELCNYYIDHGLNWNFSTVTRGMSDWKIQKDNYGKFYGPGWRKRGEQNELD